MSFAESNRVEIRIGESNQSDFQTTHTKKKERLKWLVRTKNKRIYGKLERSKSALP